jgi:hypothetical protein
MILAIVRSNQSIDIDTLRNKLEKSIEMITSSQLKIDENQLDNHMNNIHYFLFNIE